VFGSNAKSGLSLAAIFLVIMAIVGYYSYRFILDNFTIHTKNELVFLSDYLNGGQAKTKLSNIRAIEDFLASDHFINSLNDPDGLKGTVEQFTAKSDFDRALLIANNQLISLDSQQAQPLSGTFPFPRLLTIAMQEKVLSTSLVLDDTIYYAYIIPFKNTHHSGWIIALQNITPWMNHYLQSLIPKDAHFITMGLTKHPNQPWQWTTPDNPIFNQMVLDEIESLSIHEVNYFRKNNRLYFFMPFSGKEKNIQMAMALSIDIVPILEDNRSFFVSLGILTLSGMLLFFIIGFFSTHAISRTIKNMFHALENLGNSEFAQPIPVIGSQDTKKLATKFNEMIDDLSQRQSELITQSRHDPNTKLPNRLYFLEYVAQRLSHCDPQSQFAIVTISIGRFTQINHTLGHPIGQRLLHHVGARLSNSLRKVEMVGHLNSSVFVALFPNISPSNYTEIANKIMSLFEAPFSVYTVSIDLDALLGFSFYPQDGVDADILIQKADVALYAAKNTSERYAVYSAEKDPHHFTKLSLMSELREGLHQNEFQVYYQPKIDLKTDKISQVEALIRWIHPVKGFMTPALFIPMAEETGHIKRLTIWTVEQGIIQCAKWHKENIPLSVSLNLSVKDLLNRELYDCLTQITKDNHVDPKWITLEITESAFMHEPESAMAAFRKLRGFGFQFSIDDFGTGFSSLSYLKQMQVNELKVDQSFIKDITQHERVANLVKSAIELGHSLDMEVVAEGVEDIATYELLKEFNCDIGQGYLFSKPLSVKDLDEWMKSSEWGI